MIEAMLLKVLAFTPVGGGGSVRPLMELLSLLSPPEFTAATLKK